MINPLATFVCMLIDVIRCIATGVYTMLQNQVVKIIQYLLERGVATSDLSSRYTRGSWLYSLLEILTENLQSFELYNL